MSRNVDWDSIFAFSNSDENKNILLVEGVAIELGVPNANKWAIMKEEAESIVKLFKGLQVRKDHGKTIDSVVGKVIDAYIDETKKQIRFKAEIIDKDLIDKIMRGYVNSVSIGADATGPITCSSCGISTKPIKTCKCENSYSIVKNIIPKEISFVVNPAYENTRVYPVSFIASINDMLDKMSNPKEEKHCENKICKNKGLCEFIKQLNPDTKWTMMSLKDEFPESYRELTKLYAEKHEKEVNPKMSEIKVKDVGSGEGGDKDKAVATLAEEVRKCVKKEMEDYRGLFMKDFVDHIDKKLLDLEGKLTAGLASEQKIEKKEEKKKKQPPPEDDEVDIDDEKEALKKEIATLKEEKKKDEEAKKKESEEKKKKDEEEKAKKEEKVVEEAQVDTKDDGFTGATGAGDWMAEVTKYAKDQGMIG